MARFSSSLQPRRNFRYFNEDNLMSDPLYGDIKETLNILDVEGALIHFRKSFNAVVNKHAPIVGYIYKNISGNRSCPKKVNKDEGQISDPKQICEAFNQYFIDTAAHLFERNDKGPPVLPNEVDDRITSSCCFGLKEFTCQEVYEAMLDMDPRSAIGEDGLEPYLLRFTSPLTAIYITHIFNLSVSTGTIPKVWKASYVTPIHKGGETSDLNNYRQISKLSCLAKILEKLVSNQLNSFLTENQILHERQSAYRKNHNPVTAATVVLNDIITALDNNQHCAVLFTDLSKAFDTVDQAVLLKKLQRIGFDEKAFKWFENYFQDRRQSVTNRNVDSRFRHVGNGVPQGSVLAPVLFNIYMADIASSVTGCNVHMFADDTVLYCSAGDAQSTITTLQQSFNDLQNEFRKHKLVLNANKTKYMIFTSDRNVDDGLVLSSLDGTNIERVKKYKYLGLWIDEGLNFTDHVTTLASDLRERIYSFERENSHLYMESKKDLIRNKFLSKFHKGDILYMHASRKVRKQLNYFYHSALKFIQGHGDDADRHTLYHEMGLLCPSLIRKGHLLLFIYKALNGFLPPYIKSMIVIKEARTSDCILLQEPTASTKVGKTRFSYFGPKTWNKMQETHKLDPSVSFWKAKSLILSYLTSKCSCQCRHLRKPKWGL
uniref:ribonuclease H n=1 Tax=Xiphophorus maculatus TaxID=8083 RepID=M4AZN2_XIPMA